jgi:hypothetical protein
MDWLNKNFHYLLQTPDSDIGASGGSFGISTESTAEEIKVANGQKMEKNREEREEKDKTSEDQLIVIHGAKIKFNTHLGEFKVLSDVPTTQDKLTGTIVEKQIPNFTFYDGFQMISLTNWLDFGTVQVQENEVLIKKSKLPGVGKMPGNIPPETGNIEFVDSGQVHIPESINTEGAPLPDEKQDDTEYIYYNKDGFYLGGLESSLKVFISTQSDYDSAKASKKWSPVNVEANLLKEKDVNISHTKFIRNASTTYGESSTAYNIVDQYEFFAIASVHKRNKVAYGVNSDFAKKFRALTSPERNKNEAIKYSIAAEINALVGGKDYSNGAKQWDGAEQTHLPATTPDIASNGKFMFKINVMGWDITDEHFASWKSIVSKKFGEKYFNVPQKKYAVENYGGMTNKNKIRLNSSAQYGLTMFWEEIDIKKPKEK